MSVRFVSCIFAFATVPVLIVKSGGRERSWANMAEEESAGRACERVVLRETLREAEGGAERKDVRPSRIFASE